MRSLLRPGHCAGRARTHSAAPAAVRTSWPPDARRPGYIPRGPPPAGGGGGSRPALWAVPPAPSGLRAAPLPALGGWSPPAPPACGGRGHVAAKAGPLRAPARSSWPPAVARGHPSAKQGQAPAGPLAAGLALLLPRAGCGAGAPGRPGPHCVGAVGPSAPPARSAALRPAVPPGHACGAGLAGPALPPPSPPGVAAASPSPPAAAKPGLSAGGALACGPSWGLVQAAPRLPCGAAILTPPARAPQAGPLPALRAAGAQGYAACGRDI